MAQHDFNIANQSFPSFRTDLNNALSAINTSQSGTSRPSGAVAGTIWLDTTSATTPTLKYYDGADDISLATLDHSANTVNWLDSTVSITGLSTTATGTVLTLSDSATTSTVNLIIDNDKEIRFREATANGTNYVSLSAPASLSADLTFTLPATDGTSGQALTTNGSGVLSFSTISSPAGFRNIFINGDMQIAQRSTSVASISTSGYYTLDRFRIGINSLGTWTMSQSTDVPSGYGFANSLKLDCTTADASPAGGDLLFFSQIIEGQNLQYLKKGTGSAVSLTASFWVKSTKTGTFIVELQDNNNNRSISKSYTVNTTNTWEFKTITFAGDTTGAFTNNNGDSLYVNFWLGSGTTYTSGTLATSWATTTNGNRAVGQVNIADSTSNDFLITGIQLEAGTSATDFEFLPIDVSLGRCQRYYQKSYPLATAPATAISQNAGIQYTVGTLTSDTIGITLNLPVVMRTAPTGAIYDLAGNSARVTKFTAGATATNDITINVSVATEKTILVRIYGVSAMGIEFAYFLSAEL
jgi:hypothetical protein